MSENSHEKPLEELYDDLGQTLTRRVLACLNEALVNHGGRPTQYDGMAHPLSEFISQDMIPQVLAEARRLAEQRELVVGDAVGLSAVVTDDDALIYLMGDLPHSA